MAAITVTDLRKEYSVLGGSELAVDDVSFEVEEGEFITIVGPSGCGKTTTLRCIAGLETPTSGTIEFHGENMNHVPPNKRDIAMMFQNIALYPHMTVMENISYPLKVQGVDRHSRQDRSRDAAEIMKIEELLEKHPGELSGGQRQRAALARTIVQDPVAFLMDEPLSDLDAKLKTEIRKEILRVHKQLDKPTLYVTHDQEEAMTMSDRIIVMNDGEIEQMAAPENVYQQPNNIFVAEFIGNPSMNFWDGSIDSEGENVNLEVFGQAFELEGLSTDIVHDSVTVGARPQDCVADPDSGHIQIAGTLSLLELIDNRALATIDTDYGEVRAVIPGDMDATEGEPIEVGVAKSDLYLFNAETGESLQTAEY